MTNRVYDVTLGAAIGSTATIGASGTKVKLLVAAAGPVGVKVDGGPEYTLSAGQGFRLQDGAVSFRDITVRNLQAVAQTVQLFVGDSYFDDTTITGNVKVIDQAADKTSAGGQFMGGLIAPANGALTSVSLLHGNGTTKRLAVRAVWLASGLAGILQLGIGTGGGTFVTGGNAMQNKLVGGPAPDGRMAVANSASITPTTGEIGGRQQIMQILVTANVPLYVPFVTPIVLSGTQCLYANSALINRDVQPVFEWEELA